jgi:hypothetical protein
MRQASPRTPSPARRRRRSSRAFSDRWISRVRALGAGRLATALRRHPWTCATAVRLRTIEPCKSLERRSRSPCRTQSARNASNRVIFEPASPGERRSEIQHKNPGEARRQITSGSRSAFGDSCAGFPRFASRVQGAAFARTTRCNYRPDNSGLGTGIHASGARKMWPVSRVRVVPSLRPEGCRGQAPV